jgi:hypothetical protein
MQLIDYEKKIIFSTGNQDSAKIKHVESVQGDKNIHTIG